MILLRFRVTVLATSFSFAKSYVRSGFTNMFRAIEARLQTAISSFEEYSTISVHRFEHLIVPTFCWLLLRLHASL
uniref:Putative secreted protein n=1 Tax=Anopheles triannulatus TaxID=58253 RepID=A0A2M4B5G7_9DIPT